MGACLLVPCLQTSRVLIPVPGLQASIDLIPSRPQGTAGAVLDFGLDIGLGADAAAATDGAGAPQALISPEPGHSHKPLY